MRRITLAAALLAAAPLALAQAPEAPKPPVDIPKPSCGTPPELPGRVMMQDSSVRKRFETDVQKFKECMKAYVDERQAAAKANAAAGNDAVNDFNAWAKALDEEQKRRRGVEPEGGAAPPVKSY
jgi:hypothetical protein